MQAVFTYADYRKFVKDAFKARVKNGFGQASKLALEIAVNTTFVSQVLKGDKNFSSEQALATANFLNLNQLETQYFLLLVQLDRAGTLKYKSYIKSELAKLKAQSEELVNRLQHEVRLTEEQRATFYSDWIYSAVRLATLLPNINSVAKIAAYYSLPEKKTKEIVDFLLQCGLLKQEKGELRIGPLSTHLDGKSPWIKAHHSNWRQQALNKISEGDASALHYSAPMTMSFADAEKIRELLIEAINNVDKILEPSPSEKLVCLNIDWFTVK